MAQSAWDIPYLNKETFPILLSDYSSMVKSDNEIGKFIKIWYVPGGLAHQGQCELIF